MTLETLMAAAADKREGENSLEKPVTLCACPCTFFTVKMVQLAAD